VVKTVIAYPNSITDLIFHVLINTHMKFGGLANIRTCNHPIKYFNIQGPLCPFWSSEKFL